MTRRALTVATPMRLEAALVGPLLRGAHLRRTGMGPVNARAARSALGSSEHGPLLVLGFCGGLDEHSVAGEVIVGEEVYGAADEGHDGGRIDCALAGEMIQALTGRGLKVRSGPIVSVAKLALGERRGELLRDGALAVDMESLWLLERAGERPCGVVRVVLDSPRHELLRPAALPRAIGAARALRSAARAVDEWRYGL